jgi:hypothetical protein
MGGRRQHARLRTPRPCARRGVPHPPRCHCPPPFRPGSTKLVRLELHCPALTDARVPQLPHAPLAARPAHAPVAAMLRENARAAAAAAAEAREQECRARQGGSAIPAVHRPLAS